MTNINTFAQTSSDDYAVPRENLLIQMMPPIILFKQSTKIHNHSRQRYIYHFFIAFLLIVISGGYSNLGARGKNFQKLMLSEKKKRSDLGLHIFLPKSRCFLKKKVFTLISSLISLFFSQNQGVL